MGETDKKERIEAIAAEVRICKKCRLWRGRNNAVPGEGDVDADVVFIGEAPGHWEDVEGKPFVGAAGTILDEALKEIGLRRNNVFITNIVKCRPPKNRDPRADEVKTCTQYLEQQLKVINPQYIVALGRHSTAFMFSRIGIEFEGITSNRGRFHEMTLEDRKVKLLPVFHPAAVLYNANLKSDLMKDMRLLRSELKRL